MVIVGCCRGSENNGPEVDVLLGANPLSQGVRAKENVDLRPIVFGASATSVTISILCAPLKVVSRHQALFYGSVKAQEILYMPPSATRAWPVTNPESSLARKRIGPTMSCGWAKRLIACCIQAPFFRSGGMSL